MAKKDRTIVLEHEEIQLITERFAHQIFENHHNKKSLVLVGIDGHGFDLAKRIKSHLDKLRGTDTLLHRIALDKSKPRTNEIELDVELSTLKNADIILIDDVLNSGKTLVYALRYLLDTDMSSVTTVVLVDRIHRRFPIKADYVGMSLSTTLQERVELELGKKDFAYLV